MREPSGAGKVEIMLRWLAAFCAIACLSLPAWGQWTGTTAMKRGPTLELSGGYAHTNFHAPPGWPNVNGFYLSVGLNITRWFQIYGDGDMQFGSIPQGNTRMYGDHIGARFYKRTAGDFFNPYAEFLVGASRLDLNLTPGGQKYSEHGFSFRAGGGLDLQLSPHWAIRAIEADYYRTPFLNSHQNNLWLATGVVFTFGNGKYPR